MTQSELRSESRISVTRRGTLSAGGERFPCILEDMSDSGCLLMCTRHLAVGQILDFKCELYPDQILECKLQVMHVFDGAVGTRIIEIDEAGARLAQLFLQENFVGKLARYAPKAR